MANKRNLKKDINWLTEEVVSDCLVYFEFKENRDEKQLAEIINTIISKRNELFTKINKPTSNLSRIEVKNFYNQLVKEMFQTTNDCLEKLSALAKK